MKKFSVFLTILGLLFLIFGCENSVENPVSESQENVSAFLSALPKKGGNERFLSTESMKKCQDDMEQIAKALSTILKESQVRSILKEELKKKDAFWEISFNQLMSNEISNGSTIFDLMVENGLSDLTKLLKKHPDLRLSIPERYEDSFDPLSDFKIAILPVENECDVKEIISFDFQGNRIVLDPEILCDTPLLVLEIDENPDNHPSYIDNSTVIQIPQYKDQPTSLNLFNGLSKTTTTVTKLKIYYEYLYNKLEGTLGRPEFNVTVTVGDIVYTNDYLFPTTANRGFGITEINHADCTYDEERWIWNHAPDAIYGSGKVLGICLWEDDPGGEDKLTYYSADQILGRPDGTTYNPGYLDADTDRPDDLYGYVFLKWSDFESGTGYNGKTYYAYGYNSSDGGNNAWRIDGNPKNNVKVKFKKYDVEE